jgi:hypothetical protein
LHVIEEDLQSAVDPTVVEVETEASDFEGLAAALMLSGVDSGVQLLEDLIVARKKRTIKDLHASHIDGGSMDFAVITTLCDCDETFSN